jgi:hypothetical protein
MKRFDWSKIEAAHINFNRRFEDIVNMGMFSRKKKGAGDKTSKVTASTTTNDSAVIPVGLINYTKFMITCRSVGSDDHLSCHILQVISEASVPEHETGDKKENANPTKKNEAVKPVDTEVHPTVDPAPQMVEEAATTTERVLDRPLAPAPVPVLASPVPAPAAPVPVPAPMPAKKEEKPQQEQTQSVPTKEIQVEEEPGSAEEFTFTATVFDVAGTAVSTVGMVVDVVVAAGAWSIRDSSNLPERRRARVTEIWQALPKKTSREDHQLSDAALDDCWKAVLGDEVLAPLMSVNGDHAGEGKTILKALQGMRVLNEISQVVVVDGGDTGKRVSEETFMKLCDLRLLTIARDAADMMPRT